MIADNRTNLAHLCTPT